MAHYTHATLPDNLVTIEPGDTYRTVDGLLHRWKAGRTRWEAHWELVEPDPLAMFFADGGVQLGARFVLPAVEDNTREMAREIRRRFGYGGARFPGSAELHTAAEKIEQWDKEAAA